MTYLHCTNVEVLSFIKKYLRIKLEEEVNILLFRNFGADV